MAIIHAEIVQFSKFRNLPIDVSRDEIPKATERLPCIIDWLEIVSVYEFGEGGFDAQDSRVPQNSDSRFGPTEAVADRGQACAEF